MVINAVKQAQTPQHNSEASAADVKPRPLHVKSSRKMVLSHRCAHNPMTAEKQIASLRHTLQTKVHDIQGKATPQSMFAFISSLFFLRIL